MIKLTKTITAEHTHFHLDIIDIDINIIDIFAVEMAVSPNFIIRLLPNQFCMNKAKGTEATLQT